MMITQGLVREWSGQNVGQRGVRTFSTQRTSRFGVFVVIFFVFLFIFNNEKECKKKEQKSAKQASEKGKREKTVHTMGGGGEKGNTILQHVQMRRT